MPGNDIIGIIYHHMYGENPYARNIIKNVDLLSSSRVDIDVEVKRMMVVNIY